MVTTGNFCTAKSSKRIYKYKVRIYMYYMPVLEVVDEM
jgi:hypothetical protein